MENSKGKWKVNIDSSNISSGQITNALREVQDPELNKDIISLDFVREIEVIEDHIRLKLQLTTPACPLKTVIEKDVKDALNRNIKNIKSITINFDNTTRKSKKDSSKLNLPFNQIIAISSGKGGVGKSTISVNIACSLAKTGASVGLLDIDIYGPNIPRLLGIDEQPLQRNGLIVPFTKYGISVISMGVLIPPNEAMVWRGPMLHTAINQLLTGVAWPELDYLIVDLPPGTGDAQLSITQLVHLSGGIIVTTPQRVSIDDAARGANAFDKLEVPIIGVIENMTGSIFGEGTGKKLSEQLKVDFLGSIPMDKDIALSSDTGIPLVHSNDKHPISQRFIAISKEMAGKVSQILYK